MIHYIDAFPERMHHPKEDRYLFARLIERDPGARDLVNALVAEHVLGAKLVRELERAVIELEQIWPDGAEQFAAQVDAYAQFHWNHMRREESELIPRAVKALREDDWSAIEAAFAGNDDPIANLRELDFEQLFSRIVALAPDPIGLGARWKKAS
jgi:hemerythrin-like domain-containing protein